MRFLQKFLQKMCFVVLASGLALGQSANSGSATSGSVADELKALREAIGEQQKQIAQQQQQIQTLEQRLQEKTSGTPHVADATLHTASPAPSTTVVQETEKPKESPLSFRIGGTEFTPGGFVDFENIFRSTNTGNTTATTFGAIPFSNTVAGHLTEYRATGQYSRYNLKVTGKYGANNVTGYLEGDFNGNDAANVFVTSNPHTNRVRLYWVDLKRGSWEFLAGQSWGLETPNRKGLSPNPADLMLTIGEDANVHVGIPYTRAGLFRAVWHANDNFQWGVEVQNPQQYVGTGEVVFPFVFNAQLNGQLDAGATPGAPNLFPDIITKFAWDTGKERGIHFEAGGMLTTAKITVLPVGGTDFSGHSKIGGAVLGGVNVALAKSFRVVAHGMYGSGIGRYMIGSGPNAIVFPVQTGPATFDADVSMVHSGSAIAGVETGAGKSQFGFYYGGFYFQRNAFLDLTNPVPGRFGGFGGINSPNAANRAIQEGTIDWTQTFWKNPQYGAVLLVTQASYLTRAPWFVPAGAPKNAHLGMGYLSLRYVLP
jgi:uncharacterized coiled-coil protein SlyX